MSACVCMGMYLSGRFRSDLVLGISSKLHRIVNILLKTGTFRPSRHNEREAKKENASLTTDFTEIQ